LIGEKPVHDLADLLAAEGVRHGVVVTTGRFSAEAWAFASGRSLELIDGEDFFAKLTNLSREVQTHLLREATKGAYTIPSCPSCGSKMIRRSARAEEFWGCRNSPACRGKLSMRE
jgi:restriction system protein